tara:strand:+ start:89 stop:379 length:291 start_codon:yes stop_codon:yes gene_type:complete
MLPKTFYKQNIKNKNDISSKVKLYTITYDYTLNPYFGEYIKESYNKFGNVIDNLGLMKLTGYSKDEVEYNFHQLMKMYYILPKKISEYEIKEITHS